MRERSLSAVLVFLTVALGIASAQSTSWKFIVTGDSRGTSASDPVNSVMLPKIAQTIVNEHVDLSVWPGDLVYGASTQAELQAQLTTWRSLMAPVYDAGIGVYPIRGNHDSLSRTTWRTVFPELPDNGPTEEKKVTYSVTHENAFFVGLDEYWTSHPHAVDQEWLNGQFAANTQPHVFVFGHEPAFKVVHADCLDDNVTARNTLIDSIEAEGGRTYFCGHDHMYNHAQADDDGNPNNDFHQVLVGTAGAPLYSWSGTYDGDNDGYTLTNCHYDGTYGYVLGEVNGPAVTFTWKKYDSDQDRFIAAEQWGYTVPEPGTVLLLLSGISLRLRRR
jgi:hypothetical protein